MWESSFSYSLNSGCTVFQFIFQVPLYCVSNKIKEQQTSIIIPTLLVYIHSVMPSNDLKGRFGETPYLHSGTFGKVCFGKF